MHWGTVNLTNEDLRELPELLSATWKPENLANDPLAIPAIGGRPVFSMVLTHSTTRSDSLLCSLLPCPAQRLNRLCSIPTWSSALPMLWWMISMIDSGL